MQANLLLAGCAGKFLTLILLTNVPCTFSKPREAGRLIRDFERQESVCIRVNYSAELFLQFVSLLSQKNDEIKFVNRFPLKVFRGASD